MLSKIKICATLLLLVAVCLDFVSGDVGVGIRRRSRYSSGEIIRSNGDRGEDNIENQNQRLPTTPRRRQWRQQRGEMGDGDGTGSMENPTTEIGSLMPERYGMGAAGNFHTDNSSGVSDLGQGQGQGQGQGLPQ